MATPTKVIVYVWAKDILGSIVGSVNNAVFSVKTRLAFNYGNYVIDDSMANATFDSRGYAQLQIVESQTSGIELVFGIVYQKGKSKESITFKPVIVPNAGAVNLTTLTDATRGGLT